MHVEFKELDQRVPELALACHPVSIVTGFFHSLRNAVDITMKGGMIGLVISQTTGTLYRLIMQQIEKAYFSRSYFSPQGNVRSAERFRGFENMTYQTMVVYKIGIGNGPCTATAKNCFASIHSVHGQTLTSQICIC